MNRIFKQSVFLFLFAVMSVSFFGCGKNRVDEYNVEIENEEVREVKNNVEEENNDFELKTDLDTSDWLTYRNEEYGFSFKYPKDWFCGGVSLDPKNKKSIFCSLSKFKDDYYKREENNLGGVMINVVEPNSFSNEEDEYGFITKTIKGKDFNLQIIYFPFNYDKKNKFLSIIGSIEFKK